MTLVNKTRIGKTLKRALLGLAILWVGFFLLALYRDHAAVRAYPPQGQFIDVNGQRIHAVVMGQGPDLVLLHGAGGHTRDMTFALAPDLAAQYRVIVFDRPGLGYSDAMGPDGGSLRDQAAILQAAAQKLGADRPIVLGQSYGGAVALAWAVEHPDHIAGLVVVSGVSHGWHPPVPRRYRILSHPVWGPLMAPLYTAAFTNDRVDRMLATLFRPQPVPDGYRAQVGVALSLRRGPILTNAKQRAHLKAQITGLVPHYPQITTPTAIVHGDTDRIVPFEAQGARLARDIPHAQLFVLKEVGHMPHQTHPDTIRAAIDAVAAEARLRKAN